MIILASASPRRRDLLSRIGFKFEVHPTGVPEHDVQGSPLQVALSLAERKARALSAGAGDLVLAADTVLDVQGRLLGKPVNAEDAIRMLQQLRGGKHSVITAMAIASGSRCLLSSVETEVCMRSYSDTEIAAYVRGGEPLDKAGAYAIQGAGGAFVERIRGCYLNVVGLPLCELRNLLTQFDVTLGPELCTRIAERTCPREKFPPELTPSSGFQ